MTPEIGPNNPVPERYLIFDSETKIDDREGANLNLLSAITSIDSANSDLKDNHDYKSNDGAWWELEHSFEYLRFWVEDVVDKGEEPADAKLLSLAKRVIRETGPRIDAFWGWVIAQGGAYMFGDQETYEEILKIE